MGGLIPRVRLWNSSEETALTGFIYLLAEQKIKFNLSKCVIGNVMIAYFMNSRSFLFLFYCIPKGEVFTAVKREYLPNCVIKAVEINS